MTCNCKLQTYRTGLELFPVGQREVARTGKKRNVYRLLVGKTEGKRPLGRPRLRWMDTINIDLLEIGLSVVAWIGLALDRYRWKALVNAVMNLRVP
jgi:hypothetical protein